MLSAAPGTPVADPMALAGRWRPEPEGGSQAPVSSGKPLDNLLQIGSIDQKENTTRLVQGSGTEQGLYDSVVSGSLVTLQRVMVQRASTRLKPSNPLALVFWIALDYAVSCRSPYWGVVQRRPCK
jgi:hypothetical protein